MDGCGDGGKKRAPGLSCTRCTSPLPPSTSPIHHQDRRDGGELWVGHTSHLYKVEDELWAERGSWGNQRWTDKARRKRRRRRSFALKPVLVEIGCLCPPQPISALPQVGKRWLPRSFGCAGMLKATWPPGAWCLPDKTPPAHRPPPTRPPARRCRQRGNVISLPLISRARLLRCPLSSRRPAFYRLPLIRLEGEVGPNGINDGVRALLAAACDGEVTDGDPRPGLAILAPSLGGWGTCLATGCLALRHGTPVPTYFPVPEPATVSGRILASLPRGCSRGFAI